MVKSVGIIAIKGGVGKTTVASSLAASLVNHFGKKVLLIDGNYSAPNVGVHMDIIDPKVTIHHVLDGKAKIRDAVHNRFGVDVIPGSYSYPTRVNSLKLKDKINYIKEDYDFVIVDSSPNLHEEMLSTMLACDQLFVVSTPDYPTLSCSIRAAQIAKQRGKNIAGIIVNKIRDPKHEVNLNEIEEALEIPVVAKIPDEKLHTKALFLRIPASVYDRKSKFGKEIINLGAVLTNWREMQPWYKKMFGPVSKEIVNRSLLRQSFYNSSFYK